MTDPVTAKRLVAVFVNGESRQSGATTLAEWVVLEGLDPQAVATAIDGEFVPRDQRADVALRDGARIDVFRAIVGG